jgi:ABC-type uncharacterized transport system permease subunit
MPAEASRNSGTRMANVKKTLFTPFLPTSQQLEETVFRKRSHGSTLLDRVLHACIFYVDGQLDANITVVL